MKGRDKVLNMIYLYKKWRDTADKTGWGVNPGEHDHAVDETKDFQTIREVLLSKCSFYYDFETLRGGAPNVAPPFLMESGQADRMNVVQDDLYKGDIATQDYNDWMGYSERP